MAREIDKTEDEWRAELTDAQFDVCRNKGTERPFTGKYWDSKGTGMFRCVCCGEALFDAATKFDSGTGWPSFTAPAAASGIDEESDTKLFRKRTEVLCHKCGSHLGHVFDDGPAPTGKRYCINSVALKLDPEAESD